MERRNHLQNGNAQLAGVLQTGIFALIAVQVNQRIFLITTRPTAMSQSSGWYSIKGMIRYWLSANTDLEAKAYNTVWHDVTWKNCDLRNWLNGMFFHQAFSLEEQKQIENTKVKAEDNGKYGTDAGRDTVDKMFLLSISETERYFRDKISGRCYPTKHALAHKIWTDDTLDDTCRWFLRSPGTYGYYVARAEAMGIFFMKGIL